MSGRQRRVDLPDDVVELLRDEPGLLAIADALRATQARRRRRGIEAAGVLIAAIVSVIAFGLLHNSSGHADVIERAAQAAAGSHLSLVATVAAKAGRVELAGSYEPPLRRGHSVVHLSGVEKLQGGRLPQISRLLDQFATDYQRTLAAGQAQLATSTASTIWLKMTIKGVRYEVAIDRGNYRPVLIRVVPRGSTNVVTLDVTHFVVS